MVQQFQTWPPLEQVRLIKIINNIQDLNHLKYPINQVFNKLLNLMVIPKIPTEFLPILKII